MPQPPASSSNRKEYIYIYTQNIYIKSNKDHTRNNLDVSIKSEPIESIYVVRTRFRSVAINMDEKVQLSFSTLKVWRAPHDIVETKIRWKKSVKDPSSLLTTQSHKIIEPLYFVPQKIYLENKNAKHIPLGPKMQLFNFYYL